MTTATESAVIANRYDFVFLFDCKDGNPNGDPDMANMPRFDPETFHGLVSDVCLKRKIRDYVYASKSQGGQVEPGYEIFVLQGNSLESRQRMPFDNLKELEGKAKGSKTEIDAIHRSRAWMCQNFFDVRAFGAVMSTTPFNCGQVRGPAQITFARSIDRIYSHEHGITRLSHTTQKDQDAKGPTGTMGNKHTLAYGLYVTHGYITPGFAQDTGFTEDDLEVLWHAIANMFEIDRSAARGTMAPRGLYAFKHESPLGNAHAHKLFRRIVVAKREGVEAPRGFDDYKLTVNDRDLPAGVELLRLYED